MSTTHQRPPAPWGLFGPDHAATDYRLEIDRAGSIAVATLRAVAAAPRSFALHGTGAWQVRGLAFDVVGDQEAVTSTAAPLLYEPTNLELDDAPG